MTDFVRVKDKATGSRYTLPASYADSEGIELIDEPAVDRFAMPLQPSDASQISDAPSDAWSATDLRDWAVAHGVIREDDTSKKAEVLGAIQKATKPTTTKTEASASSSGQEAQK